MSSLLKCGTTLTEVALAIREFFLVGKRVEGTCGGYDSVISRCTTITAAERKHLFQSSTAVVQLTVNQLVVGSIPVISTNRFSSTAVVQLLHTE